MPISLALHRILATKAVAVLQKIKSNLVRTVAYGKALRRARGKGSGKGVRERGKEEGERERVKGGGARGS